MITIGPIIEPTEPAEPELPGLEATNLERLVELLLALPTVLDLAETQMALRSCDDGDDAPRDDAADKALRRDLDATHRLRVVLLSVALRAQAAWAARQARPTPAGGPAAAQVEIVRYVGLWGHKSEPEVLWLPRGVGHNRQSFLCDPTCHHGLRDPDQAYSLAIRWACLTGWPIIWKDAGDAQLDVPRTVLAGDNPIMAAERVAQLLLAIIERLELLRQRQGGSSGQRLSIIAERRSPT